jgi:hypothetical protein
LQQDEFDEYLHDGGGGYGKVGVSTMPIPPPAHVDCEYIGPESLVILNVYHLNDDWSQSNFFSSEVLGFGGAFHVGVEILGNEWTYGTGGVSCAEPRNHSIHVFNQSIVMGETDYSPEDISSIVRQMQEEWQGDDYDLLMHNCCSFAGALCLRLVGDSIPAWVDRLPSAVARLDSFGLELDDSDLEFDGVDIETNPVSPCSNYQGGQAQGCFGL